MSTQPLGWEDILDEDEEILWQGRPDAGLRFTDRPFLSVFGLFFGGFALFWMVMAFTLGHETGPIRYIFPLFGLPFLAVGVYMIGGRFFWSAYVRAHSHYTLTSKRAYIGTDLFGKRRLKSHEIIANMPLELDLGPPDCLWFAKTQTRTKNGTSIEKIGFEHIDEGRKVYNMMRDIKERAA